MHSFRIISVSYFEVGGKDSQERNVVPVRLGSYMKRSAKPETLKMEVLSCALLMAAMILISQAGVPESFAGSSIVTMDVGADNPTTISLTIDSTSINFANSSPTTRSKVQATPNTVTVTASANIDTSTTATLTVRAGGDLVSGGNTIPIGNVSWTAAGDGFVSGPTALANTPVTAGSWQGPDQHVGTFSFFLANSWSYATGNYSQTVTYTLSAP